jgi:hypothetical protein
VNISNRVVFSKGNTALKSYEIVSADWNDEFGLVVILKNKDKYEVVYNDKTFLPNVELYYPLIRWINHDTFVIANPRTESNEHNIFIFNLSGVKLGSFNGGDGIQDLEVSKKGIWISYFDEGVFGRGISSEGLVLVSSTGTVLFRFHSDLISGPGISDCYAICKGKGDSLWLFPYTDFPLVQVFPESKEFKSYNIPKKLHGASAICVRGKYGYFYDSYNSNGELFCLEIGKQKFQTLGKFNGLARGLGNSKAYHFLSISEENINLHIVHNEDEYKFS